MLTQINESLGIISYQWALTAPGGTKTVAAAADGFKELNTHRIRWSND
jgi:hypothetical protein